MLDCTAIKRQKCSQAAMQEAASSLQNHPTGLQHPLATATHPWKLRGGVYRSSFCHHLRPLSAGLSVPDFLLSLTFPPDSSQLWFNKHQALHSLLLANIDLCRNLTVGGFFKLELFDIAISRWDPKHHVNKILDQVNTYLPYNEVCYVLYSPADLDLWYFALTSFTNIGITSSSGLITISLNTNCFEKDFSIKEFVYKKQWFCKLFSVIKAHTGAPCCPLGECFNVWQKAKKLLHPSQPWKTSPAKLIMVFIRLEEVYRKQTKECDLQKSFPKGTLGYSILHASGIAEGN